MVKKIRLESGLNSEIWESGITPDCISLDRSYSLLPGETKKVELFIKQYGGYNKGESGITELSVGYYTDSFNKYDECDSVKINWVVD